jgi:membrane protease YdiL (CAAX protease family)
MNFLANVARKILFFPLTRMIIAILMIVISVVLEASLRRHLGDRYGWNDQPWYELAWSGIMIATALALYCAYVRIFERRAVTELAVRPAGLEFAVGAVIGFGLFTATIGCLWALGYYRVEGLGTIPPATLIVSMGLIPGFIEEIIMRGIVFRITEESLGTWLALLISALLFGGLHLLNPGATWFAAVCIATEAGILLVAAYVVTRRLWVPIGMHFAWNVTQGGVFGVPVSGTQVNGMLRATLTGPDLLSGGPFGAEASIFAVLVCTPVAAVLLVRAAKAGQLVRPLWARRRIEAVAVHDKDVTAPEATMEV